MVTLYSFHHLVYIKPRIIGVDHLDDPLAVAAGGQLEAQNLAGAPLLLGLPLDQPPRDHHLLKQM